MANKYLMASISLTVLITISLGCDNFITITVKENIPYPSQNLLDVSSQLHTSHITSNDDKDNIYLTDITGSRPFTLTNGKLSVNGLLDREKICALKNYKQRLSIAHCCPSMCCMYIGVTTGQGKTVYIRVNIEDENDNEPLFQQPFLKIQLHENVDLGFFIAIPKANDEDSSNFGIERYDLVQDKNCIDCFQIKSETRDSGPALLTKAKIDRELFSTLQLQVLAIDKGLPAKTGTLSVMIDIVDINDNYPVFEEPSCQISVDENGQSGREIRRLKVTDADNGINSQISYSIEDYTEASQKYFRLLPLKNGVSLLLQSTLDYELINEFNFKIVALDHGTPGLTSTSTVNVQVTNVNDEPPEIMFYHRGLALDPNTILLQFPENGPKQQSLILIHVTDKDSKLSDIFCEILYPKEAFYLQDNQQINVIEKKKLFDLQNSVIFDREVTDLYRISVSCSDSNTVIKLTHSVEIQLRITDENDNVPVFGSSFYFGRIMETNALNSPVHFSEGLIRITDADIDRNSQIKFSLADIGNLSDSHSFVVTAAQSPEIKNSAPIDFEDKRQYVFLLIAKDGGTNVLSSSATITVSVIDANDNRPEISKKFYSFTVLEEQPIGTEIGRIESIDADTDPNNRDFIYEIVNHEGSQSNTGPNKLFMIVKNTGSIKTKVVLDREKDQHVTFLVRVRNSNDYSTSRDRFELYGSSVTVNVKIEDINDNLPIFVLKSSNYDTGSNNEPVKRPVISMINDYQPSSNPCVMFPYTFTDADEGINSEVKVSLKSNPHFRLDDGHSLICPKKADLEQGSYTIYVVGEDRDGGIGSKRTEQSVTVVLKTNGANKPQNQWITPRPDSDEKINDYKAVIIFIVLIGSIIIFCFILMVVVIRTKLCVQRTLSPPPRSREKMTDKPNNEQTNKNYNILVPAGNCESKKLYNEYVVSGLNNQNDFNSDYSNNLFYPRSNTPNSDIINGQHSSMDSAQNREVKYEQLQRTMGHYQSENTSNWDQSKFQPSNYLLEPRDSGSLSSKTHPTKHDMVVVVQPYQKSINDVYLQTSFV